MYVKYERKIMVQLIQGFINSLTFSSVTNGSGLDNVDPNLVRYFRTEYGRDWQAELQHYIYCQQNGQSKNLVD